MCYCEQFRQQIPKVNWCLHSPLNSVVPGINGKYIGDPFSESRLKELILTVAWV